MVDSQLRLVTDVLHINSRSETGISELHWKSHLPQFLMIFISFGSRLQLLMDVSQGIL